MFLRRFKDLLVSVSKVLSQTLRQRVERVNQEEQLYLQAQLHLQILLQLLVVSNHNNHKIRSINNSKFAIPECLSLLMLLKTWNAFSKICVHT